jgi:hypothetical protein
LKLTAEQFGAFLLYIDARIDEKIRDANNHDSISEYLRRREFEDELRTLLVDSEETR